MDKGSFDALCCDFKAETQEKVKKYVQEATRVLSPSEGSCFLCVSLLQDFVLASFIDCMLKNSESSFIVKVHAVSTHEQGHFKLAKGKYLPFLLEVQKHSKSI